MLKRRIYLAALFVPLVVDCIGNLLAALLTLNWQDVPGAWNETLSARAARSKAKDHPVWGWTADAIDALFFLQTDHCRVQLEREQHYGGVWPAFAADWRGETMPKGVTA